MLKGCGARQYSGHVFCYKCGACWAFTEEDPPACKAEAVEYLTFYAPITLLAILAVWLVSPLLSIVAGWVLVAVSWGDLAERAQR